ncbi:BON domain-containing protein [Stieleria sp. TO1_6]|uniref:BON domain-containing protein n=1 Tax=Stieleria tagensis TaxID=2956795 RepID=UPI00209BA45A|nr:BON domain-containing protein [Stieleria tagensis]MCO8125321.1 BON domain-containing protein [Stieleria tagensis]
MRRKYLGLAIAAITVLGPASAFGGDREIAEEIMTRLKSSRDSGALSDFTLDMKVDHGVVLFRGSVSETEQKELVLAAAKDVNGIAKVVDEVTVKPAVTVVKPKPAKTASVDSDESIRDMLSAGIETRNAGLEIAPGEIRPTAAVELAAPVSDAEDQNLVAGVVTALGNAQRAGRLKGFGVDVQCSGGVVSLKGRAGSSQQRDQIVQIAQSVPGVQGVDQMISLIGQEPAGVPTHMASNRMSPVSVDQVPAMQAPYQARRPAGIAQVAAPMMGGHQMAGQPMGTPQMGAPMAGQPVAMGYGGGGGAPHYDSPNMPNYAWPGYASYPNYAALTYPQQYSPSAWPYIGPFYPYPQVPLGWRKVSLEWDDGWWNLDFTDR